MRRFGVASVVLVLIGALFTIYGAPDERKQSAATAHAEVSTPAKKIFTRRRNQRALMVLAERTGDAAIATHRVATRVAAIGQPRPVVAPPVAKAPVFPAQSDEHRAPARAPSETAQSQPSEQQSLAAPRDPRAQASASQTATPDYLPPSARQKAASAGNAAKPVRRQKTNSRQAGTRVIYRTQQTSGRDEYLRRGYRYTRPSWEW